MDRQLDDGQQINLFSIIGQQQVKIEMLSLQLQAVQKRIKELSSENSKKIKGPMVNKDEKERTD